MVTIIGLVLAVACTGQTGSSAPRDRATTEFLTGPKFQAELDKPLSGSWTNVELRTLLNKLASKAGIAILLDRRVDPTTTIPVEIVNRSLKDGLEEMARKRGAGISISDNIVFMGPPTAVSRLRTLIELRSAELQSKTNPVPESRRNALARRHTFSWDDLDTPAEILKQIADHHQLPIRQLDRVPHDLWAGNSLPSVTAAEALSLVLIQFDLTFAWTEGGQEIELIPIPETVVVERRPRAKGRSSTDILKSVNEQFPGLAAHLDGTEVVVRGTVEEHEAVAAFLNPSTIRKPAVPGLTPLRKRLFTLTYQRAPVRAIMKEMEKTGSIFVYDAAALSAAGIDLDQPIDLKLEKATVDEFFKALFTPLKLSFEIDNVTVKLTPKKP